MSAALASAEGTADPARCPHGQRNFSQHPATGGRDHRTGGRDRAPSAKDERMTPRYPAACTTAAAIRLNAVEPTLDAIARTDRRIELLGELLDLATADRSDLLRVAGFTDKAAERLDFAERIGSYEAAPAIVSELPNGRTVAARVKEHVAVLADPARRKDHAAARDNLHALFETLGDTLFEKRYSHHFQGVALTVRGEFSRWREGRAA